MSVSASFPKEKYLSTDYLFDTFETQFSDFIGTCILKDTDIKYKKIYKIYKYINIIYKPSQSNI